MTTDTHLTASGTSPTEAEFYSISDVAQRFSVNQLTVRNWITGGHLKATRMGPRTLRIHRDELARFLAAGE